MKGTHILRKWIYLALAAVMAFGVSGCVDREGLARNKKTEQLVQDPVMPVRTTKAETSAISQTIDITGEVTTSEEVLVGAKLPGKVVAVYVKDGDPVKAGQVIAQQDTTTYQLQVQQAASAVAAARSTLNQARTNAHVAPSRSNASLAAAQAQLRSAKAQLKKAMAGARDEEREQANNNVKSARSNMDTAKATVTRKRKLFADGAISQQELDVAENTYQAAMSQYDNALQAQRISQNASRPEDIESARESVRQAEESVRNAKAAKNLDVVYGDQVEAAKANLQSALTQLDLAKQNLSDLSIRSPFSGRISGRPVQIGAFVGSGASIAHLIGAEGAYFEGEVPESAISSISLGSSVTISIDALGGKKLSGTVLAINPLGQEVGRLFKVRVQINGDLQGIRPGMFARGSILVRTIPSATVVPSTAIFQRGKDDYVFTVVGDTAKLVKITKGLSKDGQVQVFGVNPGDSIVVEGQNSIETGTKVKVEDSATNPAPENSGSGGSGL